MTLALATIPDDTEALRGWLEQHIVSGDLRTLVAELVAVHSAKPPITSVRVQLGSGLAGVLEHGLSVLPRDELSHLLRQPYHLLELQEIVLVEGGPFWDAVPRPAAFEDRLRTGRDDLETALFGPTAEVAASPVRRGGWRQTVWAVAATAAVVFIATFAATRFLTPPPATPAPGVAWGWAKADAFPKNLDRAAYLNHLADEAEEWFAKRPTDAHAAAKRIAEFREGCTALLAADHTPLPPADRDWLKERCRAWRKTFDDNLARLEDTGDVAGVLADMDATVRKLSKALRDRAAAG